MPTGEIYVPLSVDFPSDPKVRALARYGQDGRGARDLYVQMLCYAKRLMSDGFVPDEEVGILVYPDPPSVGDKDAARLEDVGLVERAEGGWRITAWLKRNKSRAEIEDTKDRKAEGAAIANHKRWHEKRQVTDPNCPHCRTSDRYSDRSPIGPRIASDSSETETETETESSNVSETPKASTDAPPHRDDIERLCSHLADRIENNGAKRPTVGKTWRDSARLMLDRDQRTEHQIHTAIDWCQDDEFWRANVLSMPKLRTKYDQLRLQAQRGNRPTTTGSQPTATSTTDARVAQAQALADKYAEEDS